MEISVQCYYRSFTFQIIIVYLVLGAAEAVVWAVLGAYASIEAKNHYGHGTMMGIFSFAMSAGVFTGAILSGLGMDSWGIDWAYYVAGGAVLIISMMAITMIASAGEKEAVVA